MIIQEVLFDQYDLNCDMIQMGKDYTIAIYGGDTPHVGAVVMSIARPSLIGNGIGVSSSILTVTGHKDDQIAKWIAEETAKKTNGIVVCSCWIHIDGITPEQINIVIEKCDALLQKIFLYIEAQGEKNGLFIS